MKKLTTAVVKRLLVATRPSLFTTARSATYYLSSYTGNDARDNQQARNPATPCHSLQKPHPIFPFLQPEDFILFKEDDFFQVSASGASSRVEISPYKTGLDAVISGFCGIGIFPKAFAFGKLFLRYATMLLPRHILFFTQVKSAYAIV